GDAPKVAVAPKKVEKDQPLFRDAPNSEFKDKSPIDERLVQDPRKKVKAGPPVYTQAWFWITVGVVVAGGVTAAILVPKPSSVNVGQGTLFQ
ncbi:MAG: hypothetical protein AAGJ35_06550, partial [Myxococcota bacterium]